MSPKNALSIWIIGLCIAWAGDAGHVVSGTTSYRPSVWPVIWMSPLWFPPLIAGALLSIAWLGRRSGLPRAVRTRTHLLIALPAGLALYLYTSTLQAYPAWLSVSVLSALAVLFWRLWDPSWACAALAAAGAIIATAAEITLISQGVYHYAQSFRGLFGVPYWLPCFFFAMGTIASGLSRALTTPSLRAAELAAAVAPRPTRTEPSSARHG